MFIGIYNFFFVKFVLSGRNTVALTFFPARADYHVTPGKQSPRGGYRNFLGMSELCIFSQFPPKSFRGSNFHPLPCIHHYNHRHFPRWGSVPKALLYAPLAPTEGSLCPTLIHSNSAA